MQRSASNKVALVFADWGRGSGVPRPIIYPAHRSHIAKLPKLLGRATGWPDIAPRPSKRWQLQIR